ncbi:MAG: LysM peptidoglycan-binding domain-containing protein, partial [Lachnospiraceae bacterium]|nr:LysM peptidoglycan-binding domain-containing protein [Lachnospiraceae bacterium]
SGRGTAVKERHPYLFFIAAVCIVLITAIMAGNRAKAVSPEAEGYYKYYTSVSVEYGDTLEQLAVRYNNRSIKSDSDYISEICKINSLDNRDKIKSGESLILPYYSETFIR